MSKIVIDQNVYNKTLRRFRRAGFNKAMSKKAAYGAARQVAILPEHLNPLGLTWFTDRKRRVIK